MTTPDLERRIRVLVCRRDRRGGIGTCLAVRFRGCRPASPHLDEHGPVRGRRFILLAAAALLVGALGGAIALGSGTRQAAFAAPFTFRGGRRLRGGNPKRLGGAGRPRSRSAWLPIWSTSRWCLAKGTARRSWSVPAP